MKKLEYSINDPAGLHARPASLLSREAAKYPASISIQYGEKTANLKSIMGIMALGIRSGSKFSIIIEGEGEMAAADAIDAILKDNNII
ncbi:MAG TPA: HPr family phosphocarrier protein [Clostridia bacterium]|nr:HPr family phosphocarrier protein [Clostridia bacterium]